MTNSEVIQQSEIERLIDRSVRLKDEFKKEETRLEGKINDRLRNLYFEYCKTIDEIRIVRSTSIY